LTDASIQELLVEAGYSIGRLSTPKGDVMTFENDTVVGFVLHYADAETMLSDWRDRSTDVLTAAQFRLRRLDTKAWNAYFLLLADEPGSYGQTIAIGAIEEDLVGTRKIARAGTAIAAEARSALLALLPIQNSPKLESVDLSAEIRLRTSELPDEVMETFLSSASESTVLQLLEADQ
jgi:hypothetical protein